jgi:GNAT superfamily N-acetyltransferase
MHLQIRAAISDDAQLIADMTRAAWAGKVAATSSGHRETAALVSEQLRQGGAFILLADHQPVGSVRWLPVDSQSPIAWEMLRMGLLPDFRGHGLSRKLLEAVFDHASKHAIDELRLAVRADQSRLVDLYAAYGFAIASGLTYSHANPSEPAPVVMRKAIKSAAF